MQAIDTWFIVSGKQKSIFFGTFSFTLCPIAQTPSETAPANASIGGDFFHTAFVIELHNLDGLVMTG